MANGPPDPDIICKEAVELLLGSMSKSIGPDGLRSAFLFGRPGEPSFQHSLGTEFFYSRQGVLKAVLHIRRHGPAHLRQMAVKDIQGLLTTFVRENFWHLANETMFAHVPGTFSASVSAPTKQVFAKALSESRLFKPELELTLFPLVPVAIADDFESETFCLLKPESLTHARLQLHPRNILRNNAFPPFDERGVREHVTCWLTVRSPTIQASNKIRAVILGAVALVLPLHDRKMFSGRHVFGGRCTLARGGATTSFGNSHVPPLMQDIVLNRDDAVWLTKLHGKLVSITNDDRRHCRAMEYFYRAWPLDEPERFPWLFMALDSVFGDSSAATQKVIDALDRHGASGFPYERLKLLLSLRASVIHGGAPDVYDSDKYHRYYETYGEDPIHDIEEVAARCFRAVIFDNTIAVRQDDREAHRQAFRSGVFASAASSPKMTSG